MYKRKTVLPKKGRVFSMEIKLCTYKHMHTQNAPSPRCVLIFLAFLVWIYYLFSNSKKSEIKKKKAEWKVEN